jgi:o-succinylbenzoate synthase
MSGAVDDPPALRRLSDVRLESIRVHRVSARYRRPFLISSGGSSELNSLLVEVHTDVPGLVGYGEAAPMTPYTGETEVGVRSAIEDHLAPALVGSAITGMAEFHDRMDQRLRGQRLAKAALDIALYDLVARYCGVPVHTLLGGPVRESVEVAWVVGLAAVDDMVAEAVEYVERGFLHIKVKGGVDPASDLDLVRELRGTLPTSVEISLDANGRYSSGSAVRNVAKLADAGLDIIEQPLPDWDLEGMASIRHRTGIRVMADESIQSPVDALAIVRSGAADIVNIKVLKVGGLLPALKVAHLAEAAGIDVKIGSMPELGVATLAALHLAAASPAAVVPSDLVGPMMVVDEPFVPTLAETDAKGTIEVPHTPGLGAMAWTPYREPT